MSRDPWTPDHPVDAELCLRLVRAQFPDLATGEQVALGSGWCNDVWRLGDVAWRFPRKSAAVPPLEREVNFLSELAPRLPVPVPIPEWVGEPTGEYPAPFYGHRFLPGTSADRLALDDLERARLAPALGRLLGQLHRIPVAEARAWGLPDGGFRCDLARRARLAQGHLDELLPVLGRAGVTALGEGLEEALAASTEYPRVPVHGDVYARHLLVDEAGELGGVIDWEDACLGDPAADLCVVDAFLPEAARPYFFAEYLGATTQATAARARGFGWTYVAFLGAYALDQEDELLVGEVRTWLENLRRVSR